MRALLVDLDGTLADSLSFLYQRYCSFVSSFGGVPSKQEFLEINGPPLLKGIQLLQERHGIAGDPHKFVAQFLDSIEKSYSTFAMMPGAKKVLQWAANEKYKMAVVTSGPKKTTDRFLSSHGIKNLFSAVITTEDVTHGKPHPEPYLMALQKLGVLASDAVVIEDTIKGVAAARGAGISCVWLGGQMQQEGTFCIRSWNQLTPLVIDGLFR